MYYNAVLTERNVTNVDGCVIFRWRCFSGWFSSSLSLTKKRSCNSSLLLSDSNTRRRVAWSNKGAHRGGEQAAKGTIEELHVVVMECLFLAEERSEERKQTNNSNSIQVERQWLWLTGGGAD